MSLEGDFVPAGVISSLTEVDEVECEEDDDDTFNNYTKLQIQHSEVPHYERALRNLFGRETADRFVHPKIDESIGVAGMTASLKSQKISGVIDRKRYKQDSQLSLSTIQTNAERLWHMLRENSINHIHKEDSKLSPGLKESFNAFARGFIGRNMTPPQRSFIEDEELIEMKRRMKSKKVANVDLNSRKKHLMFDLSELQEGNQAMLMSEKSFLKTKEPCLKELLFPPLVYDQARLVEPRKIKHVKTYHEMLSNLGIDVTNEDAVFYDNKKDALNLKFFNENDSLNILKERNLFREKIKTKIGEGDTVMNQMINKSRFWQEDDERLHQNEWKRGANDNRKEVKNTTSLSTQNENKQTKTWQPLTLRAVMDFKITKEPTFIFEDDDGQFRQGACKLWRPRLAMV